VTSRTVVASLAWVLLVTSDAEGSPRSRAQTRSGYALAYDLQFAASLAAFDAAAATDPRDPAPHRAIAAITWMEILFAQGVATFEAFTGAVSNNDVIRPAIPPLLAQRFQRSITHASTLADEQLARADDADAQYQIGATAALSAVFRATVEGRTLGALTQGRRAVAAMGRARERDASRHESALVLGMSQYTVSTMSWPVRALAKLNGLAGNREAALALLAEASTPGSETETDALLLLMIVDNREGRPADSIERLSHLQRLHSRNRLLWLNRGAAAMAAQRPQEADLTLTDGIARHDLEAPPAVLGERALWFAHRGSARLQLHRDQEAAADLERGLLSEPRDWVRGRILAKLGLLALAAGDRSTARRHLTAAVEYSDRGGDRAAAKDARRALEGVPH
jgi:tetratricopeptide (TPR) repeat protein